MNISIIFEMLDDMYIQKYREELANNENQPYVTDIREAYTALKKELNSEQLKLVGDYIHCKILLEEDIDILAGSKIFNYGIKIGMQLKEQLDEID